MFTAKVSVKAHEDQTGAGLAGALRAIADELENAMQHDMAQSTSRNEVVQTTGGEFFAWTLDVDEV